MKNSPNTAEDLLSIVDLTAPHSDLLQELFAHCLEFLESAQQARRLVLTREGDIQDLGPDYQVRTTALSLLVRIATVGTIPRADVPPLPRGRMNLDDLRRFVREGVRLGHFEEKWARQLP